MNLVQKEKLTKLLKTSAVLTDVERAEWLGLLDLMNDKQLNELEKILSEPVKIVEPKALEGIKEPTAFQVEAMAPSSGIINRPKVAEHVLQAPSPFAKKLNSIVSEKELPAGKPMLELNENKNAPTPAPAIKKAQFSPPKPQAPLPKLDIKPLPLQPVMAPDLDKSQLYEGTVSSKLSTLQDLNNLNAKEFQSLSFESILKNLKTLIYSNGYHNVLFSLEKSPMYRDYINTGEQILVQGLSFEQLGATGNYLNRQTFEKFTDLLSQIQTN